MYGTKTSLEVPHVKLFGCSLELVSGEVQLVHEGRHALVPEEVILMLLFLLIFVMFTYLKEFHDALVPAEVIVSLST